MGFEANDYVFDALVGFSGEGLFCFCLGKREMDRLRVTRFGRLVWAVSFLGYASGVVDRFLFGFLLEGGCWKWPVCLSGMFHSWVGKLLVGRCTCRWSGGVGFCVGGHVGRICVAEHSRPTGGRCTDVTRRYVLLYRTISHFSATASWRGAAVYSATHSASKICGLRPTTHPAGRYVEGLAHNVSHFPSCAIRARPHDAVWGLWALRRQIPGFS